MFACEVEKDAANSALREAGHDMIVSEGELEENAIGSNCGKYVSSLERNANPFNDIYVIRQR